jgi:hypothetical protein
MKKIIFLSLTFLLLFANLISSDETNGPITGRGQTTTTASSSPGNSDGHYLDSLNCYNTGKLTFKQSPAIKPVKVFRKDGTNFIVSGRWEGTTFISEEAEIIEAGTYIVPDSKNGNKTVECPELKFSCRLVKLDLKDCTYGDGKLNVNFTFTGEGISTDKLNFQFQKQNTSDTLEYQEKLIRSPGLGDASLSRDEEGFYSLSIVSNNSVSLVRATYPQCVGDYYVYSKLGCRSSDLKVSRVKENLTFKFMILLQKIYSLRHK